MSVAQLASLGKLIVGKPDMGELVAMMEQTEQSAHTLAPSYGVIAIDTRLKQGFSVRKYSLHRKKI